jgi:hypothetical protein
LRAPERLFDGYLFDLDGTVYVNEHLGDLLPTSRTHRPKAWNSEGRGD